VVLRAGGMDRATEVKREILAACREALANYKVPAAIRFVAALDVAATGKSVRHPVQQPASGAPPPYFSRAQRST
jgi:acyl-coenzyme A synthetase/AMP-(fatty) acid ligase